MIEASLGILVGRAIDLIDRAKEAFEVDQESDNPGSDCWIWRHQADLWLKDAEQLTGKRAQEGRADGK